MASNDDLLHELVTIAGTLEEIRQGQYEAPRGSNPERAEPRATPDDIYNMLRNEVGLLERQNRMLYTIGEHLIENSDWWAQQVNG